jgi:hypothetical protein
LLGDDNIFALVRFGIAKRVQKAQRSDRKQDNEQNGFYGFVVAGLIIGRFHDFQFDRFVKRFQKGILLPGNSSAADSDHSKKCSGKSGAALANFGANTHSDRRLKR